MKYKVTEADLDVLAIYMDDDSREAVHSKGIDDPSEFLNEYIKLDDTIESLIEQEFKHLLDQ